MPKAKESAPSSWKCESYGDPNVSLPFLADLWQGSGALYRKDFCPRCFWLSRHHKLPWQRFPGIFSSIDSYTKRLIDDHFQTTGAPPPWIAGLKDIVGLHPVAGAHAFFMIDPSTQIKLTGTPDVVFKLRDDSLMIADYKTARLTKNQDELGPVYEVQLNAYRLIAKACGWPEVSRLALIYTEPPDKDDPLRPEFHTPEGFRMNFKSKFKEIPIQPKLTPALLQKADQIFQLSNPPNAAVACGDCTKMETMLTALKS